MVTLGTNKDMSAIRFPLGVGRFACVFALVVSLSAVHPLRAGSDAKATVDSKATPAAEEEDFKNWITLGIGGLITSGDTAQFNQEHRISGDIYGGIEDMHWEHSVFGKGTLAIDGHAIWDNNDYDLKLDLTVPDVGYLRGGWSEFRNWYDGNGGAFHHNDGFFDPVFPEMHIDRQDGWVELGLRLPNLPEITVRYDHMVRNGMKDSTIWGNTIFTGMAPLPGATTPPTRNFVPSFRGIDETRDIISAEILKSFDKFDVILGMRYEHDDNDNQLYVERNAGQIPPAVQPPGAQRFVTQNEINKVDLYEGHGIVIARPTDTFWITAGYSYTSLGSDVGGSRIIGTHYNASFGETVPTLQSNDHEFLNLAGTSQVDESIFNANAFWMPFKDLSAILGFRYTNTNNQSDTTFIDSNRRALPLTPRSADTAADLNNLAERFELRYTGIKNWLFYAEAEWEEEYGQIHEHEVVGVNGPGNPPRSLADAGSMNKDTSLLEQKYTVGANWYATDRLSLSGQYYHKIAEFNNNFNTELISPGTVPPVNGAERNQRLIDQDWHTDDVNLRLTFNPHLPEKFGTLSFVSRYDFMQTTIWGKWAISPEGAGTGLTNTYLDEMQTGKITSNSITESLTYSPLARLYLQATVSYVLNQTDTPANGFNLIEVGGNATTPRYSSPTVVNFRNDYWTATGSAGYALDDKTNLTADYIFYRATDYRNNDKVALPYGAGALEQTVSASISRQLNKHMNLMLRYSYFFYYDQTSGDHNSYEAHSIYSSLQYKF